MDSSCLFLKTLKRNENRERRVEKSCVHEYALQTLCQRVTYIMWREAAVKLPLSQDASLSWGAGVSNLQDRQTRELHSLHH